MRTSLLIFAFAVVSLVVFGNQRQHQKFRIGSVKIHPPRAVETREERLERLSNIYFVPTSLVNLVYHYETSSGKNIKTRHEPHVEKWLLSRSRPKVFRYAVLEYVLGDKKLVRKYLDPRHNASLFNLISADYQMKERLKLLSSSHGALQIMGYYAIIYNVDPDRLAADPLIQDELSLTLLSKYWHRKKSLDIPNRVEFVGTRYNGSRKYGQRLRNDYENGVVYT